MNLLLDTHAFLWFCDGSSNLSSSARTAIEDPENTVFVSQISAWEVAIKASLSKLTLSVPFNRLFPDAIMANGFKILATEFQHFEKLLTLPFHHRDPFDRLLLAQALTEGMTIVTRDDQFSNYGVPLIW